MVLSLEEKPKPYEESVHLSHRVKIRGHPASAWPKEFRHLTPLGVKCL